MRTAARASQFQRRRQLLSGLSHVHTVGYFHRVRSPTTHPPTHAVAVCVCVDRLHTCDSHRTRTQDIKPENLLIDADNVMKVADFGEAREIRARPPFTAGAGTRWYMSPELILHSTRYNSPVDIWACGCVFGEMLTGGAPLFGGQTEIDVLHLMCQLLGTPSKDEWPAGHTLAMERGVSFPSVRVRVACACLRGQVHRHQRHTGSRWCSPPVLHVLLVVVGVDARAVFATLLFVLVVGVGDDGDGVCDVACAKGWWRRGFRGSTPARTGFVPAAAEGSPGLEPAAAPFGKTRAAVPIFPGSCRACAPQGEYLNLASHTRSALLVPPHRWVSGCVTHACCLSHRRMMVHAPRQLPVEIAHRPCLATSP